MLYVYSYIINKMITDIKDILVGHWTDLDNKTGCTALISKNPLVASCDIRGGAPGTRDIAPVSYTHLTLPTTPCV